jgi:hypothetical protein
MPYLATAQIGPVHGSVVVLNISEDKLVIAADSLALQEFGEPNYSYCKISAFGNKIIFARVNADAYSSVGLLDPVISWNSGDVLKQVVRSEQPALGSAHIQHIAERWAAAIAEHFQSFYRWHPQEVIRIAKEGNGVLVGGIFAEATDGIIYVRIALVTFNQNLLNPINWVIGDAITDCWDCGQTDGSKICVGGKITVPTEFCTQSTDRARGGDGKLTYAPSLLDLGWDRDSLLALRLADLTIAYDSSGTVGGRIDVIELTKDGSIRWLAKKDNCPANQD